MSTRLDGKGQYLGRTDNPSNLGIANIWTLGFWSRPEDNKEHATIFATGSSNGSNEIRVSSTAIPKETSDLGKSPAELRVLIKDGSGTTIKHYGWPDWFQTETWTHTFLQWDGTDLEAFKGGILTTTGIAALVNATGTMVDSNRSLYYGSAVLGDFATFSGNAGHLGMWDTLLGPLELGSVVSGGFSAELTASFGNYTSQGSLKHYYKPGDNPSNLGEDLAGSLDLNKQRNIDSTNITLEQPSFPLTTAQSLRMEATNEGMVNLDAEFVSVQNSLTLASWFKPAQSGTEGFIYSASTITVGEDVVSLRVSASGQFLAVLSETAGTAKKYEFGSYSIGAWHHVCMTWNGTSLRVYVDGVEDIAPTKTSDDAITLSSPVSRFPICGGFFGAISALGTWHSVGLWQTPLSTAAVSEIGTSGTAGQSWLGGIGNYLQSGDLQHYYVFGEDDTSSSTLGLDYGHFTGGTARDLAPSNVDLSNLVTDVPA